MADTFQTLADLIQINYQNLADLEISDLLNDAPLIAMLASDTASNGTEHKYLKETGAPAVGFRAPNTGRENKKSTDTLVTIALEILDASTTVDKAIADEYGKGAEAYISRESRRHLKAAFSHAEKVMINGTTEDALGFVGLKEAAALNALADEMVTDAGGTTVNTASSVWMMRTNEDGADVQVITGNDGNIQIAETITQAIEDVTGGGRFTGYYTSIMSWLGLQIGGARSVGRLTNLTADAGKGLTDDLLADLYELFPAARKPNVIGMSRRSVGQLRKSRTATNATGQPAPFPTDAANGAKRVQDIERRTAA